MKNNWIQFESKTHNLDDAIWVKCIAEIRNNTNGKLVEYETAEILDLNENHPSIFNWMEGNNSCDCNRRLFFEICSKENKNNELQYECSDGLFSVNLKNKKDGKYYYKEF
jgi:hypothetical protein